MKLWKKIVICFVAVALLGSALNVIPLFNSRKILDIRKEIDATHLTEMVNANMISYNVKLLNLSAFQLVAETRDKNYSAQHIEPILASLDNYVLKISTGLNSIKTAIEGKNILDKTGGIVRQDVIKNQILDSLTRDLSSFLFGIQCIIKSCRSNHCEGIATIYYEDVNPLKDSIVVLTDIIMQTAREDLRVAVRRIDKISQMNIVVSAFIAALILVVAVVIGYLLSRHISAPLKRIIYAIKEFRRGNMDVKVEVKTRDELQMLGYAFTASTRLIRIQMNAMMKLNKSL